MKFTRDDYDAIHAMTFCDPSYGGYKPEIQESPGGDQAWDVAKKYAHVATKYKPNVQLMSYFYKAYDEACRVMRELRVPEQFYPDYDECCLRILEYPPGAESAQHTDFDFMTIQLYRDWPPGFRRLALLDPEDEAVSPGIHWGEMAEVAHFRKAMPHRVVACGHTQRSIVFFALPSPDVALITAGDWLKERYARSRRAG